MPALSEFLGPLVQATVFMLSPSALCPEVHSTNTSLFLQQVLPPGRETSALRVALFTGAKLNCGDGRNGTGWDGRGVPALLWGVRTAPQGETPGLCVKGQVGGTQCKGTREQRDSTVWEQQQVQGWLPGRRDCFWAWLSPPRSSQP